MDICVDRYTAVRCVGMECGMLTKGPGHTSYRDQAYSAQLPERGYCAPLLANLCEQSNSFDAKCATAVTKRGCTKTAKLMGMVGDLVTYTDNIPLGNGNNINGIIVRKRIASRLHKVPDVGARYPNSAVAIHTGPRSTNSLQVVLGRHRKVL